jgi:hypothetical protein
VREYCSAHRRTRLWINWRPVSKRLSRRQISTAKFCLSARKRTTRPSFRAHRRRNVYENISMRSVKVP